MPANSKRAAAITRSTKKSLFLRILLASLVMGLIAAYSPRFFSLFGGLSEVEVVTQLHDEGTDNAVSTNITRAEGDRTNSKPKSAIPIPPQKAGGIASAHGRARDFGYTQQEEEVTLKELQQFEAEMFSAEAGADSLGLTEEQLTELDEETIRIIEEDMEMLDREEMARQHENETNYEQQKADELLAEEAAREEEAGLLEADRFALESSEEFLGLTEEQFTELDDDTFRILQNEEDQLANEMR